MVTKLLSKKAIKEYLLGVYDNDERITDEFLFNGKEMTLECASLLMNSEYRHKDLDSFCYHLYKVKLLQNTGLKNAYDYDEQKNKKIESMCIPTINAIRERLEQTLGDDECYLLTDVIAGSRDECDHYGNDYMEWGTKDLSIVFDIYIFGESGSATEFASTNAGKYEILFNTQL